MAHHIENHGKAEQSFIENVDEKNIVSVDSQSIDSENEYLKNYDATKIIRKMDWKILPVMSVLYLMSFLDRTNIGNAKVVSCPGSLSRFATDRIGRTCQGPAPHRFGIQLGSHLFLLHLCCRRGTFQPSSQEIGCQDLAANHHDALGYLLHRTRIRQEL